MDQTMISRADRWFLIACTVAALSPLGWQGAKSPRAADTFPGWPAMFDNQALSQLPLSPLEQTFQRDFPGNQARFTDGRREIILRWITEGSRKLHPAGDCFKANGYAVKPQPVRLVGSERWSSFIATRGAEKLLVSERISDAAGRQWSDVSAWYWAVQLGQTRGPWWAVTVAQRTNF
jgi:hypothetical protein